MTECPDFFAPLEAWRKFNVRDHGRLLVSANHPIPWRRVEPDAAVCLADASHPRDEPCPALRCTCGYYAYKTKDAARQHGQGQVLAKVAVWGRIASHTRGYRAERIRLLALIVPQDSGWATALPALADRYHIPVTEGETSWISASPNGSSSWNPYPNASNQAASPTSIAFGQMYGSPSPSALQLAALQQQAMIDAQRHAVDILLRQRLQEERDRQLQQRYALPPTSDEYKQIEQWMKNRAPDKTAPPSVPRDDWQNCLTADALKQWLKKHL